MPVRVLSPSQDIRRADASGPMPVIDMLELHLTTDPLFGLSPLVLARRHDYYTVALRRLAELVDNVVIAKLVDGPFPTREPVNSDTVTRALLHDLLVEQHAGFAPESVLRDLCVCLAEIRGMVTQHRHDVSGLTLWSPSRESFRRHWFEGAFTECFLDNALTGTRSEGTLREPTSEELARTSNALEQLFGAAPVLTASVLPHVAIACWATSTTTDGQMESGSTRRLPGALFLSFVDLLTPEQVAEGVIHEAAHLKLFDLYATVSILDPTYDALTHPRRITVPWNSPHTLQDNRWPPDQALAALHTYLHLGVLAHRMLAHGHTPDNYYWKKLASRARDRATFLAGALAEPDEGFLGEWGEELVSWLREGTELLASLEEEHTGVASMTTPRSVFSRLRDYASFYTWDSATAEIRLCWGPTKGGGR